MNKLLTKSITSLPEPFIARLVGAYITHQIKTHARLHVNGMENLTCEYKRPYIFICNHLSNSDALLLNYVLEKENLSFVAGKKLEGNPMTNLGFTIVKTIPITPNSPDREGIKRINATLESGKSVFIFPEGTRSREAKMLEGKKGVMHFAKQSGAPIAPVGISGSEKFLAINKDMGKEKFSDADININIGKVFTLPERLESETKSEWEARSMNCIMKNIATLIPIEYRGYYT